MARAKSRHLYVTEADLERLQTLIETGSRNDEKHLNSLAEELAGAHVVSSEELPKNVITMNSTIRVKDLDTEEERVYTLAFPRGTKSIPSTLSPYCFQFIFRSRVAKVRGRLYRMTSRAETACLRSTFPSWIIFAAFSNHCSVSSASSISSSRCSLKVALSVS